MATRSFSAKAWFIIIVGSAVPHLVGKFLAVIGDWRGLPYQFKSYLDILPQYPWPGLVFGLAFSIACAIAMSKRAEIGFNEWFGMMLLCPLVQYAAPIVVTALSVFLQGKEFPLFIASDFLYALILATLTHGILQMELGGGVIFLTAVIGALVSSVSLVKNLPFYPSEVWYVCVGGFMGFFIARKA